MSTIGDKQTKAVQPVVAALPLGVVTQAEIAAAADAVNIALYSGKKLGACYAMKNTSGVGYDIVMATGSAPTDTWAKISDGAVITPA